MDFSEINAIIEKINQSSIKEFHLKKGDFELNLSKNDSTPPVQENAQIAATLPKPSEKQEQIVAHEEKIIPEVIEGECVNSPLVGVIYLKPSPDKADFVKIGDKVNAGDTLCIVEAMKVMNEIPAEKAGIITEILVENENVVEFGQPLFRIK